MNKKGIELTVNFIVVLIIGIAMLGGALMLTSKLFSQAEKYKATVDVNTQNEIRKLITDSDDLVVIYPSRKIISRTKSYNFGIGVQNTIEGRDSAKFALAVTLSSAVDKENNEICKAPYGNGIFDCGNITNEWIVLGSTLDIKKNEIETFAMPVTVEKKAPSGLYIFNVCVCYDYNLGSPECKDSQGRYAQCEPGTTIVNSYGNINKIYVQVT